MNIKKDLVSIVMGILFVISIILIIVGMPGRNSEGVLFGTGIGMLISIFSVITFAISQYYIQADEGSK